MVATLFDGNDSSSTLKIGVVPFAAAVNIGSDKVNSGWLDKNTYTAANATADAIPFEDLAQITGISPLNLYANGSGSNRLTNRNWAGCVRERSSGAGSPYELTDDAPNPAVPATLWAPYFAPDEPGAASPLTARATRTTIYATIQEDRGPLAAALPPTVRVPILGPASRMPPVVPVAHSAAPTPAQHQPTATM